MFSNRIANSAKFLQMPSESQLLYFHMILRADDDGIVEAYPLLKMLGTAPDSLKVLLVKGYIRQLNEDQVLVIVDWHEHNIIRADRKVDSIYLPLLMHHYPEIPILEAKPRSDVEDNSRRIGGPSTDGINKVKLSKDKLSKDNKYNPQQNPPTPEEWAEYCNKMNYEFNFMSGYGHYQANGWTQGKHSKPIIDWRGAARTCQGNHTKDKKETELKTKPELFRNRNAFMESLTPEQQKQVYEMKVREMAAKDKQKLIGE